MAKDYYEILGVDKKSPKEEIKKAYRSLAHKYHPDKNGGDDRKFKEINEAYQVLSNDEKRARYDQFGTADNFAGANYGGGFEGFDFSGFQNSGSFDMGDIGDIFGDFFGRSNKTSDKGVRGGRNIETETVLSFEESIFGVKKDIFINKPSICQTCSGSGAKAGTKMENCSICHGQGYVKEIKRTMLGAFSSNHICDNCKGQGTVPEEKCSECGGRGIVQRENKISIEIPAGILDGEILRARGKGEDVQFGVSGDLYVRIKVKPHNSFTREGNNLKIDIPIKLTEALIGTEKTIKTLDGKKLKLKIPSGSNNKDLLRVRGKGVPARERKGDLIVRLIVMMPSRLSRKAKSLVAQLEEEGL